MSPKRQRRRNDVTNCDDMTISPKTQSELKKALRKHFGFTEFRPGQVELIQAVMAGRDAFGLLPTSGGKSLCYQLPALMLDGLTVVVSPLIALMKDQVDAMNRNGQMLAATVHSGMSDLEAEAVLKRVSRGDVKLLYVAPERFELPEFCDWISSAKVRLLVIDEVHCVSEWGHDFRPSYLELAKVTASLRPCPVLTLTATATKKTRQDIIASLGLIDPLVFVGELDRPNLRFEVVPCGRKEKPRRLRDIVGELSGDGSLIVYVGRRDDADRIAADLEKEGFSAVAYHAGLDSKAREEAQESWMSGEKSIAVATVAFGMGIDKPDVRAVIHYQHPASLESYYQQAGRAGRDGDPAQCIILFDEKDASLGHYFIGQRHPTRDEVMEVARAIPTRRVSLDKLKRRDLAKPSEEKINVALRTLVDQGWIERVDRGVYRRIIQKPEAQALSMKNVATRRKRDWNRLNAMVMYAKEGICNRAVVLRYFGVDLPSGHRCGNCSACDNRGWRRAKDLEDDVVRLLRRNWGLFAEADKLNKTAVARFLGGSDSTRLPWEWRVQPDYGALSHVLKKNLRKAADQALRQLVSAESTNRRDKVRKARRKVPRNERSRRRGRSTRGGLGARRSNRERRRRE